jgi:hypothetical protein
MFPFPAGMSLIAPAGNYCINLFPARVSLVSDILAGDGKNDNLSVECSMSFFCCTVFFIFSKNHMINRKNIIKFLSQNAKQALLLRNF